MNKQLVKVRSWVYSYKDSFHSIFLYQSQDIWKQRQDLDKFNSYKRKQLLRNRSTKSGSRLPTQTTQS